MAAAHNGRLSSFMGHVQHLGTRIKERAQLWTSVDWVIFVLWVATLIFMFEFVAVVATPELTGTVRTNTVAGVAAVFAITLFAAIITMVVSRFLQARRESGK